MAKQRRKQKAPVNIPICLAGALLCLTMFSFHLSSGVVARYTTTASGTDTARVIKFGDLTLTEEGDANKIVIPGVPIARTVRVSFEGSEASTYVFVEVVTDGTWAVTEHKNFSALSGKLSWKLADGWTYFSESTSAGKTTYVYYRSLIPNETLSGAPIMTDGYTVDETLTAEELNAMNSDPLSVHFRASVVQSNDFDTPEAAWTSLQNNH